VGFPWGGGDRVRCRTQPMALAVGAHTWNSPWL